MYGSLINYNFQGLFNVIFQKFPNSLYLSYVLVVVSGRHERFVVDVVVDHSVVIVVVYELVPPIL